MNNRALDRLGEFLMSKVRDGAIDLWYNMIDGKMKGDRARAIYEKYSVEQLNFLRPFVRDIVDETLHCLLASLEEDEEWLRLSVEAGEESTDNVAETSDGLPQDMHGWIKRFSEYPPSEF